ncbi:hypothetical protein AOT82_2304 [Psychrobacter sp. AntiMn-1]|nr:hypothetical protein AOT82_2304 [Psychrobacter sp. AntiMn-1]
MPIQILDGHFLGYHLNDRDITQVIDWLIFDIEYTIKSHCDR